MKISYRKKPLNKEIAWDKNSWPEANKGIGVHNLINKVMIRESISKMKRDHWDYHHRW